MDYSISFNLTEGGFRIPINPASIEIKESGQSKTYDIAKLGEISVIQHPKLPEISFESVFPAAFYPFVIGELRDPFEYIEQIEKWMAMKRPVHFVFVGGSEFEINKWVSIEGFSWSESGGAVGDIEYQISLKRYVPFAARKVQLDVLDNNRMKATSTKQPPRPDNRQHPKTYTLAAGDSLWKVAQKFLGNGSRYPEIQKLNSISDAQLKRLPIGMVLKLP